MPYTLEALRKILHDHGVDPFLTMTLGMTVGTLMDRGLSDEEIQLLFGELLIRVRRAKGNPEAIAAIHAFYDALG
jgi:hypothetical protein